MLDGLEWQELRSSKRRVTSGRAALTTMRGSGLSLERFIKGKAHKTKGEAKSKKRVIVHKAQRRREYEKVKRREAAGGKAEDGDADANANANADAGGSSFYDRFFKDLQSGKVDADAETAVRLLSSR
jgi:hypothetical protein